MNRKNAAHIRRGIVAAQRTLANRAAGLPDPGFGSDSDLERRAYWLTIHNEFTKLANRALRSAKALMGEL